jgi:hypothetical protein
MDVGLLQLCRKCDGSIIRLKDTVLYSRGMYVNIACLLEISSFRDICPCIKQCRNLSTGNYALVTLIWPVKYGASFIGILDSKIKLRLQTGLGQGNYGWGFACSCMVGLVILLRIVHLRVAGTPLGYRALLEVTLPCYALTLACTQTLQKLIVCVFGLSLLLSLQFCQLLSESLINDVTLPPSPQWDASCRHMMVRC